jgi:pyridoxal phosphate enzyme (YggS family)
MTIELEVVRENLAAARAAIADAARRSGREPGAIELLAAVKYVEPEDLETLAAAGIELVGENRVEQLLAKQAVARERFEWDFIGHLQSRKVPQILPIVQRIHSVGSDSVLDRLERHRDLALPGLEILVEVNVAREEGKSGIAPDELGAFLERSPLRPVGLMTMPPLEGDSRRWFSALRELAETHGLSELSMGTSQDFEVAVEEGATIVRLGSVLFRRIFPAEG